MPLAMPTATGVRRSSIGLDLFFQLEKRTDYALNKQTLSGSADHGNPAGRGHCKRATKRTENTSYAGS
jgi:hypothetical protein